MLPQNLAQSCMQQMRGGVIPHGRLPNVSIYHGIDFVTNAQRLFGNQLMRPDALNRRIASRHIGNNSIVIVRVKPSPVTNLSARFRIKRRVVKDDLGGLARLEFPRPLPVMDDSQYFAPVRTSLTIALED